MIEKYKKIKKCRISGDKNLKKIINFGNVSLTGIFPRKKNKNLFHTPLELVYSNQSKLLQLKHNYNLKYLFGSNYGYRSSLNKSMVNHLKLKYKYQFSYKENKVGHKTNLKKIF